MKYLITGAAGFIGSKLSAKLFDENHEVVGLDNFSPYYSPTLKKMRCEEFLESRNITLLDIDLRNLANTQKVVADYNPEVIIHLAAQPGVRTPLVKSFQYIENNLIAFGNILQTAVQYEVSAFLYASSSSVYGNSTLLPYSEKDNSIKPISIYGATKLANELLTPTYVAGSKTRARGMRFFTVYGPWGRPDMAYLRIINSLLNNSKFNKFGDGNLKRDFTYIDDITAGITELSLELAKRDAGYSDVVNIGGGNPYSLNDLISEISRNIGKQLDVNGFERNSNDTAYTCADITRLKNLTGIVPSVKLEQGIDKTIKWANSSKIKLLLNDWVNSTN